VGFGEQTLDRLQLEQDGQRSLSLELEPSLGQLGEPSSGRKRDACGRRLDARAAEPARAQLFAQRGNRSSRSPISRSISSRVSRAASSRARTASRSSRYTGRSVAPCVSDGNDCAPGGFRGGQPKTPEPKRAR
jgi:hypothetical protein